MAERRRFTDTDAVAVITMAMATLAGYRLAGVAPSLLVGAAVVYATVSGYTWTRNDPS
jgi:hypothetical protein